MSPPVWRSPGIARRAACLLYDALLITAVVFIATFPALAVLGDATTGFRRHLLQVWVLVVVGAYLGWFWSRGGQTLAMKTWRIRLEGENGGPVAPATALRRYAFALAGTAFMGAGFLWAIVDRDRQFLHDRLARTRLASVDPA